MSVVRIPVSEDTYWTLVEKKAKLRAKTWDEFFEKLLEVCE